MPYGRAKNPEVVERVQRGQILGQPSNCPNKVYEVRETFEIFQFNTHIIWSRRWWGYAGPRYQRTGQASELSRRSWLSSTKTWTWTSKLESENLFCTPEITIHYVYTVYSTCDIHQTLLYWNYFSCYLTDLTFGKIFIHSSNVNKEHIYFPTVKISLGCQSGSSLYHRSQLFPD